MTSNLKKRINTSLILFLTLFLIFNYNFILLTVLMVLGIVSIIEFFNITGKIIKGKIYLLIFNSFFIIYIFIFCYMFFYFSNFLYLKMVLFVFLLGCVASDIGGYVFGNILRGPKLTKISPKKTIAGSIGSIIFANIIISGLFFYFTKNLSFTIILVGTLTSISCQTGDLFISYLKRKAKIKDTGNFLPGHGGVLDRLDGIILGMPLSFLALALFN